MRRCMDTMLRELPHRRPGTPEARKIVDKPVCGRITLSAGRADDEVVITLIGGAVELSTHVGVGTTVRVRIPTRSVEQPWREVLLGAGL
jgi:hypothetical protein